MGEPCKSLRELGWIREEDADQLAADIVEAVSEEEIVALLPAAFRVLGLAMPMTPEEVARAEAEMEEGS